MNPVLLTIVLTLTAAQSSCPMTIGVGNHGEIMEGRFHGWYSISTKTLISDLHSGCYNDANPSPVTSVRLMLAPKAPNEKTEEILSMLAKEGWQRERIHIQSWSTYPQKPE